MHGNSSSLQWGAAGSDLKANIDLKISVNQAGTPDLLGNTAPASTTPLLPEAKPRQAGTEAVGKGGFDGAGGIHPWS